MSNFSHHNLAIIYFRDYGYFGIQGYQVYNNVSFLSIAESTWEFANNFTISPAQAAAGMTPVKSLNITSECQGGE
jgi:hypothetical protein